MRTIEQSLKNQENGIKVWWILFIISILSILSPALADKLISFDVTMAAAFFGIVLVIISGVMIRVYNNRKKLVASLFERESVLDVWECSDRYNENKGLPIQAYFSLRGVFYAGNPYSLKSYECVISCAKIVDDEGMALSVIYTVPNSRMGTYRNENVLNIPVPDGKEESAKNLANFYSIEAQKSVTK